jgi:hypothetical protein|eukprot:COSAG06_NODE_102_length_23983_cov_152.911363_16_plen_102_part_00
MMATLVATFGRAALWVTVAAVVAVALLGAEVGEVGSFRPFDAHHIIIISQCFPTSRRSVHVQNFVSISGLGLAPASGGWPPREPGPPHYRGPHRRRDTRRI